MFLSGCKQEETRETEAGISARKTRIRKLPKDSGRPDNYGQTSYGTYRALLLDQLRLKHQCLGVLIFAQRIFESTLRNQVTMPTLKGSLFFRQQAKRPVLIEYSTPIMVGYFFTIQSFKLKPFQIFSCSCRHGHVYSWLLRDRQTLRAPDLRACLHECLAVRGKLHPHWHD